MIALIIASILALGVLTAVITHRHRNTHMRPVRYHDDVQWHAFDRAMSRHTGGKK